MADSLPAPGPGESAPRVPLRAVLFSMVVLWATYFLLTTVRSLVMDIGFQFELAWRRLVVTAIGIALTLVLWLLLRLFDNRALWIKISAAIVLALPVALAIGQVNYWVFKDMSPAIERAYGEKLNLNLRRDESGNLLVDVPLQGPGGTAAGTQSVGAISSCLLGPRPILPCSPGCRRARRSAARSSSALPPRPPSCAPCAIRSTRISCSTP